jgi:hypothetical protein
VHLDGGIDTTNSIRARPTPSAGSRHQRKAAEGSARFSMMRVLVCGDVVEADIGRSYLGDAFIDDPLACRRRKR